MVTMIGGSSVNVEVSVAWFHHLTTDVKVDNCEVETISSASKSDMAGALSTLVGVLE